MLPALLLVTATSCAHGGEVTRVAFGSCAHQDRPQPIWDAIGATAPERFLFIGDNVYADTTDPAVMKAAYAKLAAEPHYRRFAAAVPV
ncbi:MAG: alkaline phosphatase family protein, partial [Deltaproteobacteria bacterium]